MNKRYTVATVADIPVRITRLWILLFIAAATFFGRPDVIYTAISITNGVTPANFDPSPLADPLPGFAFGLALTIGLYITVLLHEFGHALEGRRRGLDVDGITLWAFGGVASIEQSDTHRGEAAVVGAGPVVTAAVTVVCGAIGTVVAVTGIQIVAGYLLLIALFNALLLAFNLLPVFPTDGGRLLQLVLAAQYGEERGTRYAIWVAAVFVGAIGVISLYYVFVFGIVVATLFLVDTWKARKRLVDEPAVEG